jgi:hypothetical protein
LNENDRKVAKKLVAIEMAKINRPIAQPSASDSSRMLNGAAASSVITQSTFDVKVLDEFDRVCGLKSTSESSSGPKRLSVDEEISFFVKAVHSADDFQRFWKQNQTTLPRLASLVRRYNVCPATSVASESTFSIAGYLNRKQRSSLSSTAMRYSMVLKNKNVLNKLKKNI